MTSTALAMSDAQATRALTLTDDELLPVLQSSLYPGAKPDSIRMVLGYCRASGLDPMQKPVHIVPMRVKKPGGGRDDYEWRDVVMPGVGLYRTQAARTGAYVGVSEPEFGPARELRVGDHVTEYPEWCRVTVKRMMPGGFVAEFTAVEYWTENYATAGRDTKKPNDMWSRRPRGQIAKCAEAQALRKAFPEIGAQPTADEASPDDYVIDGATGQPITAAGPGAPAGPKVARKAAATIAADVVDAQTARSVQAAEQAQAKDPEPEQGPADQESKPARTSAPASDSGAMCGAGEIAYLKNKAKSLGLEVGDIAGAVGRGDLVIEAGKLSKADFDRVRAELVARG